MNHTLIAIGSVGAMRVYLDVPLEEARERYQAYCRSIDLADADPIFREIEFTDEFEAYDVWEIESITS